MATINKGDWVKVIHADYGDKEKGIKNGDVGQVVSVDSLGGSDVNFSAKIDARYMCAHQLAVITPAEAASVGDTVTVEGSYKGDYVVVTIDNDDPGCRVQISVNGLGFWVADSHVKALKRKPAEVAKPADPRVPKVGDYVKVNAAGARMWDRRTLGEVGRVIETYGVDYVTCEFAGGSWSLRPGEYELTEAPAVVAAPKPLLWGHVPAVAAAPSPWLSPAPANPNPAYIIISDEGASSKPFKHHSATLAIREAERLSKIKPGVNFTVYRAAGVALTAKPVIPETSFQAF